MSLEFVDTNIFIYAHDSDAGRRHSRAVDLLSRLMEEGSGAISTQVLVEFYAAAVRKLAMHSQEAEEVIADMGVWAIHRPDHADVVQAARMHRRYRVSWWDALVLRSATAMECGVLWSEDLVHGQKFGSVQVRNPFL